MALSAPARAALYAQETDQALLPLLTISHADLTQPIRLVADGQNQTSRGNTFIAYPFSIDIPDETGDQPPTPRLTIDNVAEDILVAIRALSSAPTITLEVVLSGSLDTVEAGPFALSLLSVDYDALTITGQLGSEDMLNESFPGDAYTPANFPGLF
jgi:hypothetical protein